MASPRDQITSFDTTAPAASYTETIATAGSNRLLLVAVEAFRTGGAGATTDSVTHDGDSLTRLDFVAPIGGMELSFWYLVAPVNSGDLVINCTNTDGGDGFIRGTIFSYKNVRQTSTLQGTPTNNTGAVGANMVFSVTSAVPNVLGVVVMFGSGVGITNANNWSNTHPRPMVFDYVFNTTAVSMTVQGNVISGNGGVIAAFALTNGAANFFPFY